MANVTVIIPTKSNRNGLSSLLDVLYKSIPPVAEIYVITDGPEAQEWASECGSTCLPVPLGVGIQAMWNVGMNAANPNNHVLLINDDVTIDENTVKGMAAAFASQPDLGIVSPLYDNRHVESEYYIPVYGTCGGNYSGGGGLAGFCMMLSTDLAREWRFDERLKWWHGDDDVLMWVRTVKNRGAGITPLARCSNNNSWTIDHDPPADFLADVEHDKQIYWSKWNQ